MKNQIKAIKDYLSSEYSQFDICIKYEISSVLILQHWIMLYNNHHNITKSYPDKGSTLINYIQYFSNYS
ncbi:hypothetical protein [Romboutsia maritimum]|uniref:hypothetical protein n=1 Tax=Romboutsia maritimum TaxID=2020948 RepID=UPI000BCBE1AA|nr:hypothetical protein [Romboutsia maritimum]